MFTVPFILFNAFVVAMLVLDLLVFNRKAHEIKMKEALGWSAFWIFLALAFSLFIWRFHGSEASLAYLAGYLVEKSLSVDNIFVFIMIFSYFAIPGRYQHKILFWGIVGALVMRGIFIFAGVALISKFHWILYVLGVFLIVLALKIIFKKDLEIHPEKNLVLKLAKLFIPVTHELHDGAFFIKKGRGFAATPLFVALIVVETTDIVFAIDSIPAVMAITLDPFLIYTSNVFAILGLRALYFAVAGLMKLFEYLHYGIGAILAFVGTKMLISPWFKINVAYSLLIIAAILLLAILCSVFLPKKKVV